MSKVTNQVEMNLDGIFLADRDNEGPEKNETMSVHQRVSYIPLQELGRCEAWRTTAQTIVEFMDSRTGLVRQPQAEKMLSSETRIEKDPGLDEEVSECVEGTVVSEIQTQVRRHLENMGLNSCQNLEPQFRIEAALERMLAVLKTLDRAAEPRPLAKATTSNLDDSGLHCTFENKSYGTTQRQYGHKLYVPKTRSISVSGWSGTESSFSGMPGAATSSTGISTHSTRSPLSSISFCSDYQLPISPGSLSNRAHSLIGARGFLPETLGPDFLPCNSQPHTLDPASMSHGNHQGAEVLTKYRDPEAQ